MFLKLNKFNTCDPDYMSAQNSGTLLINYKIISRIETEDRWKNGKPWGSYTVLHDFRGNTYNVTESANEIYKMIKQEES